jgi:uncharacterized membrane protein
MSKVVTAAAILVILAATVLYSLFAHHLTATDDRSELSYVFALASLYFVAICLAIGSRWRRSLVVGASITVLVGWWFRESLFWDPRWVYLLQHVGTNLGLALLFGLSLRAAKGSLVTRMARIAHGGQLPPHVERYTRQVTMAWTLFFLVMSLASIGLFLFGNPVWWSIFVNFLSFPLVILMFVFEYVFRLFHVRDFEHKSILEGIRSYSRMGRNDSP